MWNFFYESNFKILFSTWYNTVIANYFLILKTEHILWRVSEQMASVDSLHD